METRPLCCINDAFNVNWSNYFSFAFPPFAVILKTLNKVIYEKASGILVVSFWPTQPWFSILKKLLASNIIYFEPSSNLLNSGHSRSVYSLHQIFSMTAAIYISEELLRRSVRPSSLDILINSLSSNTRKQYNCYFKEWFLFCHKHNIDCVKVSVSNILYFLTYLYNSDYHVTTICFTCVSYIK